MCVCLKAGSFVKLANKDPPFVLFYSRFNAVIYFGDLYDLGFH